MITTKIPIAYGRVVRIENGRIYVRNGDVMDVYNAEYYRVPVEFEDETKREVV